MDQCLRINVCGWYNNRYWYVISVNITYLDINLKYNISGIAIDKAYQIIAKDGTLTSVCTATGDNTVDIKWRKNLETDEDLSSSAVQQNYVPDTNSRISTLTIATLTDADHTSDKYECYITVDAKEIIAVFELDVVGKNLRKIILLYIFHVNYGNRCHG